ncbi:hypothetical protein Agub_g913 [Astrephomene gubernaculifera]|uniref:Uncharacterized protein n=1 Tax=Astrephomene gubernaculifera TaxID=47775 RepID=A0AAD3DEL3_9CHLO|nr:hypothetical protein Agub_g913 [Astrephomene gubernaculifera]
MIATVLHRRSLYNTPSVQLMITTYQMLLGNLHMSRACPERCGCGSVVLRMSQRLHFFWACPVEDAVVEQLEIKLGAVVPRAALWLALPPSGVQQCVWDALVLGALSAMVEGRRFLRACVSKAPAMNLGALRAMEITLKMGWLRAAVPRNTPMFLASQTSSFQNAVCIYENSAVLSIRRVHRRHRRCRKRLPTMYGLVARNGPARHAHVPGLQIRLVLHRRAYVWA